MSSNTIIGYSAEFLDDQLAELDTAITDTSNQVTSHADQIRALRRQVATLTKIVEALQAGQRIHVGDLVLTVDGTIITGSLITGQVDVRANDCLVEHSTVRGGGKGAIVRLDRPGTHGNVIRDCVIAPEVPVAEQVGVRGWGTIERCHIHHVEDGIVLYGDNGIVTGNTIEHLHQLRPGAHSDGVQVAGGSGHRIEGNQISNSATDNAAIMVNQNSSPVTDLIIRGNTLRGQNTPAGINLAKKPTPITEEQVRIEGNDIGGYLHEVI